MTTPKIERLVKMGKFLTSWYKNWHMPHIKRHQRIILDNNGRKDRHGTLGMTYRLPDADYGHRYKLAMPRKRMGQV